MHGNDSEHRQRAARAAFLLPQVWLSDQEYRACPRSRPLQQNHRDRTNGETTLTAAYPRKTPRFLDSLGEDALFSPRSSRRNRLGKQLDLVQGTLDMLILKAVSLGALHGYGIL